MPIDRGRRHPLCPYCRYDLVATVHGGGNTCPECGESFEPHELLREHRPGDWTERTGLVTLFTSLLLRSIIGLGIWALWLWLVSLIPITHALLIVVILAGHIIVAVIVAKIMWTRLRERCGFDGLFPAGLAILAAWLTCSAGAALIGRVTTMSSSHAALAAFLAAVTALITIGPSAILDD